MRLHMLQHDVLKMKIGKPSQVLNELHSNIPSVRSQENDQVYLMSFYQAAFFTKYTNTCVFILETKLFGYYD